MMTIAQFEALVLAKNAFYRACHAMKEAEMKGRASGLPVKWAVERRKWELATDNMRRAFSAAEKTIQDSR